MLVEESLFLEVSFGGIIGGTVERCYSKVDIQDDRLYETSIVGGLIGYMDNYHINEYYNESIVDRCYSTGDVYGTGYSGGLIGYISAGIVENCYSLGNVMGQQKVGGLGGYGDKQVIENCYVAGTIMGEENVISPKWPKSTGIVIDGEACGICIWGSLIFNCVILSEKIESYGYILGYITSDDETYGELCKIEGNYILKDTQLLSSKYKPKGFISDKNKFKSKEELTSQKTYEEMGWKFTGEDAVWEFSGEYKLPKLIGVGGQDELLTPEHLL